jgi:hypothetical protein
VRGDDRGSVDDAHGVDAPLVDTATDTPLLSSTSTSRRRSTPLPYTIDTIVDPATSSTSASRTTTSAAASAPSRLTPGRRARRGSPGDLQPFQGAARGSAEFAGAAMEGRRTRGVRGAAGAPLARPYRAEGRFAARSRGFGRPRGGERPLENGPDVLVATVRRWARKSADDMLGARGGSTDRPRRSGPSKFAPRGPPHTAHALWTGSRTWDGGAS